jgi:hypothetical protein
MFLDELQAVAGGQEASCSAQSKIYAYGKRRAWIDRFLETIGGRISRPDTEKPAPRCIARRDH